VEAHLSKDNRNSNDSDDPKSEDMQPPVKIPREAEIIKLANIPDSTSDESNASPNRSNDDVPPKTPTTDANPTTTAQEPNGENTLSSHANLFDANAGTPGKDNVPPPDNSDHHLAAGASEGDTVGT